MKFGRDTETGCFGGTGELSEKSAKLSVMAEAARDLLAGIEKQMLGEARDVREVTDYSYRRGEATLLELLDAQRTFNETMQAFNEARAEHARSLYLLEAVSGKAVNP